MNLGGSMSAFHRDRLPVRAPNLKDTASVSQSHSFHKDSGSLGNLAYPLLIVVIISNGYIDYCNSSFGVHIRLKRQNKPLTG